MFLDEELLLICMCYEGTTPESIQQLNKDVCQKCEDYYKSKIKSDMSQTELKAIIDRTFNLWNSFVRMLLKDNDKSLNILGKLFTKFTFKDQFFSHKELSDIYNKL